MPCFIIQRIILNNIAVLESQNVIAAGKNKLCIVGHDQNCFPIFRSFIISLATCFM